MSETKTLFIPEKIKVGYNERKDTYTGRLAYVIYFDSKGKLRKEKSWTSWCNSKLGSNEFENSPTEGFFLNKGVGGVRQSYGWNTRNEYIRVYDPRNFEFEISVANLLFILRECDCSRGKGLEGQFVYAWDGTELVLLPASCEDFKKSQDFTELQSKSVSAKNLIPGATYKPKAKGGNDLIYLGRFDRFRSFSPHQTYAGEYHSSSEKGIKSKSHVFFDPKHSKWEHGFFFDRQGSLATCVSEDPVQNLAELVKKYSRTRWGSSVNTLDLVDCNLKPNEDEYRYFAYQEEDGSYVIYTMALPQYYDMSYEDRQKYNTTNSPRYRLTHAKVRQIRGTLHFESYNHFSVPKDWPLTNKPASGSRTYYRDEKRPTEIPWVDAKTTVLVATLESGEKYHVSNYELTEKNRR